MDPLILTATFDGEAAGIFQNLRDRHFPAKLNIVPAHLTLFHHLPGAQHEAVHASLTDLCATVCQIPFKTAGLRFLGRGVAFEIKADALSALRAAVANRWRSCLTAQDAQTFRPHVTVQNKADGKTAKALLDTLVQANQTIEGTIIGLDLWHYRRGPWEKAHFYGL